MSVPLISSVAFTEVDSAGTLNDKAGTTKSKLPVQFFRLTGNISGNLTMTDDSAHKKIILDTNGNNIINSSGSPITNNSSTDVVLKGSGNVQSTLLTFTSEVADTSNTGTTTISAADNSTVVVTAVTRDADISESGGVSVASGFGGSFSTSDVVYLPNSELISHPANPGSNTGLPSASAQAAASAMATIVGSSFENITTGFSITLSNSTHGIGSTTLTSPTSTTSNSRIFKIGTATTHLGTFDVGVTIVARSSTDIRIQTIADPSTTAVTASTVTNIKIPNNTVAGGGRTIAFTNNLAISCVLSGADPFDGVTVAAGATNTQTRTTADGSFSLTGTISGSDGSSRPFAMKDINDGTGSVDETDYTGTKSVSAF
jgi:hypothetical protein